MRNSSKDLSVFDFASEQTDEAAERFTKYQFLKAFSSDNHHLKQADVCSLSPIDSLEVSSPQSSTPERNVISTVDKFEFNEVLACTTNVNHAKRCPTSSRLGGAFQEVGLSTVPSGGILSSVCDEEDSETQSSETPVYLMSDVDCTSLSGASSMSGDLLEAKGLPECSALGHCHSACEEMDEDGKPVVFCPDFVTYGDAVFLESQISFCLDCISIECSEANGTGKKLMLEHDITDVIRISCQWSRSVDAILIKFWIRTDLGRKVDKFLASVTDMCLLEKGQVIKLLAKRYTDIWDSLPEHDYAFVDDIFRNCMSFSKRYFTEIAEPFEDVIYPKGDADAVCISKRDIELLEPNTFINDTIIDFYIKYLQDKITPIDRKRFYFFNSFFFRKLADLDKNPASISEGRAAFQRVRKWTRKVNIFEKDYLFIPVNFNLHWSLLVICHPGEITTFNSDAIKRSPKVPCILHMDSIKGSHSGLKNLIQSYLFEEWKGRNSKLSDDISSKFSNLRFVSLELPQQENSSDCGLFVLHYVELFLKEAPICFNPYMITKLSSFLNEDWFPPAEASFKRFYIRGLLYELLRDSAQERNPIGSSAGFPSSGDDVEQVVQFLSTQDSPSKLINGTVMPHADQHDSFEKTATLETGHTKCPIEEVHGDGKAILTELLESDAKEVAAEQLLPASMDIAHFQPSYDSPNSRFCSTVNIAGSSEIPCISIQEKQETLDSLSTTSDINLAAKNERDEAQKMAPLAFDACTVVPDTPDTICDEQQLKERVKNSQENGGSEMEVEMAGEDNPAKGVILVETHATDSKGREEATYVEGNTSEAENRSSQHCSESTPATPASKFDDLNMLENADGDDCQEIIYVAEKEGIAGEDRLDTGETSKQNSSACSRFTRKNSDTVIRMSVETVGKQTKRPEASVSEQRVSKRFKVVDNHAGRRITRSSSRKLPP